MRRPQAQTADWPPSWGRGGRKPPTGLNGSAAIDHDINYAAPRAPLWCGSSASPPTLCTAA
jgi:hypothetical protein